ncbi:UNVERIFIED_CONTAM: putative RNA-dependent RNA polymerase 3, partial [Sesamum indicum]
MDASSPDQEVRLPEPVEMIIQRICLEKNQPPLKKYARNMLAEIGEQAALEVLTTVLSSKTIRSFGGYVAFLVKKDFPNQAAAVLSAYGSPHQCSTSPNKSPHTPYTVVWVGAKVVTMNYVKVVYFAKLAWILLGFSVNSAIYSISFAGQDYERLRSPVSSFSVDSIPSNLNKTGPQNIRCNLSFENETLEKSCPGARCQSPLPDELREMTDSVTISQQLMILSQLQFRKLFLVLSYIGRQKLEAVVNLDGANEIYSMKDLPMNDFEAKIWNSYGKKFCEESDRSQYLDWDSQKTHHYYCHVCRDGSYYFKDENDSIIHDEDGKPILHTDGTGYISVDLAMKCPRSFSLANDITDNSFEKYEEIVNIEDTACQKRGAEARNKEPPLLIQCRLFYDGCAVKGTLLINRKLEPGTIQIRPSMIKVERDQKLPLGETFKSLEIVAT